MIKRGMAFADAPEIAKRDVTRTAHTGIGTLMATGACHQTRKMDVVPQLCIAFAGLAAAVCKRQMKFGVTPSFDFPPHINGFQRFFALCKLKVVIIDHRTGNTPANEIAKQKVRIVLS